MNKSFFKGLITGVAFTLVFVCVLAVGAATLKNIEVVDRDIKVFVDGKPIQCINNKGEKVEPFIVKQEDTTYVPLRSLSEALGVKVDWIDETSTIYLGEKPYTGALVPMSDMEVYLGENFKTGEEFNYKQGKLTTQNSLAKKTARFSLDCEFTKLEAKVFIPDDYISGSKFEIHKVSTDANGSEDLELIKSITHTDGLEKFGDIIKFEVDVTGLNKIYISAHNCAVIDAYLTPIKR